MIHFFVALVLVCGFVIPAYGEYYRYEDPNGNVIFTDNPSNIPENRRPEMKTVIEPESNKEPSRGNEPSNIRIHEDILIKGNEDAERRLREYMKKEYNAKETCNRLTRDQAERSIRAAWTGMAQAMVSGNREKAFGFFSVFSRDEMKRKMSGMKQEELKNIFGNFKSIEIQSLHENDGIAECGVLRKEGLETYSYPASFVRDPDCEWRIRGF